MSNSADGKFVVVKDGQRTGAVHEDKAKADAEAEKLRRQIQEQQGRKPADVSVKRNLFG